MKYAPTPLQPGCGLPHFHPEYGEKPEAGQEQGYVDEHAFEEVVVEHPERAG